MSPVSPRVMALRAKMNDQKLRFSLKVDNLTRTFDHMDDDVEALTTRTEPSNAAPKVSKFVKLGMPMLSLGVAKTIVREETAEGAAEVNYFEFAQKMHTDRLKQDGERKSELLAAESPPMDTTFGESDFDSVGDSGDEMSEEMKMDLSGKLPQIMSAPITTDGWVRTFS